MSLPSYGIPCKKQISNKPYMGSDHFICDIPGNLI